MLFYLPASIELAWDYVEAHHYKGPYDGISGAVKQKFYSDVSTQKILIMDAHHFAIYVNTVSNINVYYLDKSEINLIDVSDSIYIPGTLKIHHVFMIGENSLEFYKNLNYKKDAEIHNNGNAFKKSVVVTDLVAKVDNLVVVRYETKKELLP